MNKHEYYAHMFPKIAESFDHSSWVLASGLELIARGWDPDSLLVTVEPMENLHELTVGQGLEVYIPVCGRNGSVLAPVDFEIFLSHEGAKLYADWRSQLHYHEKHIVPVSDFFEKLLQGFGIPYMLDLTPSGGHFLFHAEPGTAAYPALASIGWLESELVEASCFNDPRDLKRNPPPGFEAASVFSGIGRLWHYVSLLAKHSLDHDSEFPITICDSEEKCVNLDNSWQADAAYMRIMRSPFSLHAKNVRRWGRTGHPLVDVVKTVFNGEHSNRIEDMEYLVSCMWNFDAAIDRAEIVSGHIPVVNDSVIPLIDQYKRTGLHDLVARFDHTPDLPHGEAFFRAVNDKRLSDKTHSMLDRPYPRALQPNDLKKFIGDLLVHGNWEPKHIGCLINDLYRQSHDWNTNWQKYPSRTRANYWARTYTSVILLEQGVALLDQK